MTEKGGANTSLERFLANMEYGPADQVPNYELGVWSHTQERWENEGLPPWTFSWDWFRASAYWSWTLSRLALALARVRSACSSCSRGVIPAPTLLSMIW